LVQSGQAEISGRNQHAKARSEFNFCFRWLARRGGTLGGAAALPEGVDEGNSPQGQYGDRPRPGEEETAQKIIDTTRRVSL